MFSEAEVEGFEERYKSETKDSQANNRYHQWVQMYYPDQQIPGATTASSTAKVLIPAPNSAIEKFLKYHLTLQCHQSSRHLVEEY